MAEYCQSFFFAYFSGPRRNRSLKTERKKKEEEEEEEGQ